MEDEERKVDLSHRTIQDEQARLRKKRQKAENVFAVFKKPLHESLTSVLPVMLIVLVLCFTIAPVPNNAMVAFLLGGVMLIAGMGLFTLGSEMSMIPLGQAVGSEITRRKKVWIITVVGFLIGMIITVAEPDLQVLANQVPAIENNVIIWSVAVGVGVFLVIALLRIVLGIQLRWLLIGFYTIVFTLAMFVSPDFWAVAFDSGGVTTGPMTVPFIMALGVGVCAVRSDKQAGGDSFGLVALCSVGPVLAVLALGVGFAPDSASYTPAALPDIQTTRDAAREFAQAIPHYAKEVALALVPICALFLLFQLLTRRFHSTQLLRIALGLVYTYVGLVMFLSGVNVGFMPVGELIGATVAAGDAPWFLIPIGMVMGYFIVAAEPAVHVLIKQVEEVSMGAVSQKAMRRGLSIGVAVSVGIAMLRVLTGVSILWFLVPGYAFALGLTFFVPQMFTGIAFDSGGVASGPMTATFLLPFAMGACSALGGDIMTDAFGLVAMVAMTPLVTIQLLGLAGRVRRKMARSALRSELARAEDTILYYD